MDYFKINAISRSDIVRFIDNPPKYLIKDDIKRSAALEFGTVVHTYLLEPHRFADRCLVLDKIPHGSSNAYKELVLQHSNKILIDQKTFNKLPKIFDSVLNDLEHEDAEFLMTGEKEKIVTFESHGIKFKSMFDVYTPSCIIDIKTTESLSTFNIANSIKKYKYDIQDVFYSWAALSLNKNLAFDDVKNAVNSIKFKFLFIEKHPPYATRMVEIDVDDRVRRSVFLEKILNEFNYCYKNNVWPNRYAGKETLFLGPDWTL